MSYTECHVGKIVEITPPEDSYKEKWLVNHEINLSNTSVYDNYTLYLDNNYKIKFISTKSGRMFVLDDVNFESGEDLCLMTKENHNVYNYVFQFYNGGTDFHEMLTNELNKIEF